MTGSLEADVRILVIEDSAPTRDLLERSLVEAGAQVVLAARIATGMRHAMEEEFDAIVLDLMLPDGDGLDLCRELRTAGVSTPILCLTAKADVADRVQGLDAGADDYLRKPFALSELRARLRALSRRGGSAPASRLEARGTRIDFDARRLERAGQVVPLTAREWAVLELLATRSGRVVEREHLLEIVWQDSGPGASGSFDVILSRLRRKLGGAQDGFAIRTVRGQGLVFEPRS